MTNFKNNDFESVMLGRHSVRKFDTSVKIPREELKEMVANAIKIGRASCRERV